MLEPQGLGADDRVRRAAISSLVERAMRSRSMCRPQRGQKLSGIYLDIYRAAEQNLYEAVSDRVRCNSPESVQEWVNTERDVAFRAVLTRDRLEQLAIAAQQCPLRTAARQHALVELLGALQLSGKLRHHALRYTHPDWYDDAVSRSLLWVCQNLDKFDPQRGPFLAWVNFRLDMICRQVKQEAIDPFVRAVDRRVGQLERQLQRSLKSASKAELHCWAGWSVKPPRVRHIPALDATCVMTIAVFFRQLSQQDAAYVSALLAQVARSSVPTYVRAASFPEKPTNLVPFGKDRDRPLLSEAVRHYFEVDPNGLMQKHVRDRPEVTFQQVALRRLRGETFQDMSESLGIKIPTLSNFFQRNLRAVAPDIKQYVRS